MRNIEEIIKSAKPKNIEFKSHKESLRRALLEYAHTHNSKQSFLHYNCTKKRLLFLLPTVILFVCIAYLGITVIRHNVPLLEESSPQIDVVAKVLEMHQQDLDSYKYKYNKFLVTTYTEGKQTDFLYETVMSKDKTDQTIIERDSKTGKEIYRTVYDLSALDKLSLVYIYMHMNEIISQCEKTRIRYDEETECIVQYYNRFGKTYVSSRDNIFQQVNYRFFRTEGKIGSVELEDQITPPYYKLNIEHPENLSENELVNILLANGYVEVTYEDMKKELDAYYAPLKSTEPSLDQQYEEILETEKESDPMLMSAGDIGQRSYIRYLGHYYIQAAPIISYRVQKAIEENDQNAPNIIVQSGYVEISMDEFVKLMVYGEDKDELFFNINPASSAEDLDPDIIFDQLVGASTKITMQELDGQDCYLVGFSSTTGEKAVYNEVYVDRDTFAIKQVDQYLGIDTTGQRLLTYKIFILEYLDEKPAL